MLPKEQILSKYTGVWNLSSDQGNLGAFIITNVRVVWFAQLSDNFNVSLPWIQIKCIRVKDSKYGTALVFETSDYSGGYVLGFRLENIEPVYEELQQLFQTYIRRPYFGVECVFEGAEQNLDKVTVPALEDSMEIVETGYEDQVQATRLRYQMGKETDVQIVFNDALGLACEAVPAGVSLEKLWKIA